MPKLFEEIVFTWHLPTTGFILLALSWNHPYQLDRIVDSDPFIYQENSQALTTHLIDFFMHFVSKRQDLILNLQALSQWLPTFFISPHTTELFKYFVHLSQNMNILYSLCSMIGLPQIFRNSIHAYSTYPVFSNRHRIIMVNVSGTLVPCISLLLLLLYTLIFFQALN